MRISILISLTLAAMALAVGTAHAQGDGGIGTTTPSDEPAQGGSGSADADTPDATPDPGGAVELTLSNARPRKAYLLGSPAIFRYAFGGNDTRDLEVEVVSKSSREVVATIDQNNVTPKQQHAVAWGDAPAPAQWPRRASTAFASSAPVAKRLMSRALRASRMPPFTPTSSRSAVATATETASVPVAATAART